MTFSHHEVITNDICRKINENMVGFGKEKNTTIKVKVSSDLFTILQIEKKVFFSIILIM